MTAKRTDSLAVYAAVACGVAAAVNVGKVPIALGQLRQEFDLSLVSAGWVASMLSTLAVFTALFIGVASDRIGHLRMAAIGLVISFAATLAGLFVETGGELLLSRFSEGVGFLAVVVAAPGLVTAAAQPADRRFALGIWATYLPAGVGLSMLVAPLLLPLGGWRSLWLFSMALLALSGIAIYRQRQAYTHHTALSPHSFGDVGSAVVQPMSWLLAFALCSWAIQYFALVVWLPTFFREQRGMTPGVVALLSTAVVIINVPGNLLGGSLVKHHFRRGKLIMLASLATCALSCAVYLDLFSDIPRYLSCLALSFSGGLISASVLSSTEALAKSPRQIGTLQGLFIQCAHLGQFVGPPLIAALVARSGLWHDALFVTGSAAIIGVFLGLAIYRIEGRQPFFKATI